MLRREEMRVRRRRVAIVAVVAARIVREAEARLVAQLVRRGGADAAAEPVDELRARLRAAGVDALAMDGHHLHPVQDVEPHAAARRRRIREAGGIEPRAVRCVFDSQHAIGGAALAEPDVEAVERAVERCERRLFDPRLLGRGERIAVDAPGVGERDADIDRLRRAARKRGDKERSRRQAAHSADARLRAAALRRRDSAAGAGFGTPGGRRGRRARVAGRDAGRCRTRLRPAPPDRHPRAQHPVGRPDD